MTQQLTAKKVKEIQNFAVEQYRTDMAIEGRSRTPEYMADALFAQYENAIIEDGMVTGYYRSGYGVMDIPKMPKYTN